MHDDSAHLIRSGRQYGWRARSRVAYGALRVPELLSFPLGATWKTVSARELVFAIKTAEMRSQTAIVVVSFITCGEGVGVGPHLKAKILQPLRQK
jgi:hypothetical protein